MNELQSKDPEVIKPSGRLNYPEVAVVILNWNGKGFLSRFLPSVTQAIYPNMRVIIADNASTDDSIEFIKQFYPAIEIIINPSNEGFAKGYNTALKQIKSDYYVLLNSDVEVTSDWIGPVISLMEANKNIAACQPKILAYNDKQMFEYAGASGGWIDDLGYPFMRGRIFEVCEKDLGQYNNASACFWASGAAMFVRASVYHDAGGLDEYFFAHQEEIDLCWRMQRMGYAVYTEPASVVYHVGGGTLPKGNSRKTYLNFRNNLILLHKNLPAGELIWKIPARLLLNGITALKSLFAGDSGYFIAVIKSYGGYIRWVFSVQKSVIREVKNYKLQGVYQGSVVWQYFIKKRSRFSEIISSK